MHVRSHSSAWALLFLWGCGTSDAPPKDVVAQVPAPPAPTLAELVGEYVDASDTLSILEEDGGLWVVRWHDAEPAEPIEAGPTFGADGGTLSLDGRVYTRLDLSGANGGTFRITPLRPPSDLMTEALAAAPPDEEGAFLPSDLVEIAALDPSVRVDVRYATTNNFMGEQFYSQPRVFLQRPAAEAALRAHHWLIERGYGLLLHDGYRPWYVTKMFWDATPEPLRGFVANPERGSRHNRGCAVDLTLYHLDTGEVVEMPGGYDEFTPRAFPDYPGGTERQRWHRELLRQAMEAEGFTVNPTEWWHFDHPDWQRYRLGNQRFEELG